MNPDLVWPAIVLAWGAALPSNPSLGPKASAWTILAAGVAFSLVRIGLIFWALNMLLGVIRA